MSIIVRRIRADEALAYREIRLGALAESPTAFSAEHAIEAAKPMAYWQDRAGAASTGPDVSLYAAITHGGDWVGLVGAHRSADGQQNVELFSMWVSPLQRKQGIGGSLVRAVLEWARSTEATCVELWVMKTNADAEALYRAEGFEPLTEFSAAPGDPCENELRMRHRLPAPP